MKKIILAIKLILRSKFIFKTPSKCDLIVFDEVALSDLNICLSKFNFFVLQTRIQNINKIYFSYKILREIFKNYFKGNLLTVYLVSLIETIKPKVVITSMDTSFKFFDVAKILEEKISFIAIQSAARYDVLEYNYLHKTNKLKDNWLEKFYIPNLFCFGDYEKQLYRQLNIKVKNIYPIGDLRFANSLHKTKIESSSFKKYSFDICLIADACASSVDKELKNNIIYAPLFENGDVERGYVQIIKYTIKFCIKNSLNLVIPLKRDKKKYYKGYKKEIDFFKVNFSKEEFDYLKQSFIEKDSENFTSFKAVLSSKVVVGTSSTLLRDKLATEGKIFSCNLTKMDIYNFPINGICTLNNCSYEEFEKRLLEIFFMSEESYLSKNDKKPGYVMKFNKNFSTINLIREKLTQLGVDQIQK